ncbi:hypothetical protein DERP_008200 [Dermatophagoides pteronyssinus]|uniref:Uncharacterized protein n=1 Tax=Dermatophagoides pteronyssinus TaxID=6956 RepID=A0ABQ8JK06_DERPT|nr:hypothetical protein DERP_008200 [Dermatophagoides pteronyssinus]
MTDYRLSMIEESIDLAISVISNTHTLNKTDCPPPPLYDCGDDDDPPIISVSQPSLQSFIKLFN